MTGRRARPARRPPALSGLNPAWSRLVDVPEPGSPDVVRTWHVLDSGERPNGAADRAADRATGAGGAVDAVGSAGAPVGTLLCVHGNPTWSYLWRGLLAAPPPGWRVVAPDQLGMGFSERLAAPRTLSQRIADLSALTAALDLAGPVVTVAHDWGGPISLGWALAHRDSLRGVVLANTAVHQPAESSAPGLIRLARTPGLRHAVCVATPTFVRAATSLSRPALDRSVRDAYAAPYGSPGDRRAVGDFVADIPLEADHVAASVLAAVREDLDLLADVPVLLLWGPRDPVFGDRYLRDLLTRLPHAAAHRYAGAGHLVPEDAATFAADVAAWVGDLGSAASPSPHRAGRVGRLDRADRDGLPDPVGEAAEAEADAAGWGAEDLPTADPLWAALTRRAAEHPDEPAVVELGRPGRSLTAHAFLTRVRDVAAGLDGLGVRAGDRVALLVPPGTDLATVVYACWRIGAVVVLADAGLGARRLGRALREAGPAWLVAGRRGLTAARVLRIPGRRVDVRRLAELAPRASGGLPPPVGAEADAAVLFTSGATGPPKGVLYRHRQLDAQVAALRATYGISSADRLVAAFAPFALYGPALGIASAIPDVDVTRPGTLTATALGDAVEALGATLVFAAPAALRHVVETADALSATQRAALRGVRLVLSAGAPVPVRLLRAVREVLPAAELHTPYGMTEVLPVTDVSLDELAALEADVGPAGDGPPGDGVCVGRPVPGVDVAVSPLDATGAASGPPADVRGVTGEVCVRAAHAKERYDRLWVTERAASRDRGWHRTGDVGRLDHAGRLWVQGRLAHVVVAASGVVPPVGVEQRVEGLPAVRAAACVGVGPRGTQQVAVVVVPARRGRRVAALAGPELTGQVRAAAAPVEVAAVLQVRALPVDVRHQSKVDRDRVARWADRVLAGGRAGRGP